MRAPPNEAAVAPTLLMSRLNALPEVARGYLASLESGPHHRTHQELGKGTWGRWACSLHQPLPAENPIPVSPPSSDQTQCGPGDPRVLSLPAPGARSVVETPARLPVLPGPGHENAAEPL